MSYHKNLISLHKKFENRHIVRAPRIHSGTINIKTDNTAKFTKTPNEYRNYQQKNK